MPSFGLSERQHPPSTDANPQRTQRGAAKGVKGDWKIPGAIVGAGVLIALAISIEPTAGIHEIQLSEQEFIRVDTATGMSQACMMHRKAERCITLSGADGKLLPHIRDEMRELGVRSLLRVKLRGG